MGTPCNAIISYQSHGHSVQSDAKTGDMRKYYWPLNVKHNTIEVKPILNAIFFPFKQWFNLNLHISNDKIKSKKFPLLSLQSVCCYWLAWLLTQITGGASECGQITLTGRHAGKHTGQETSPPMGACHHVTCAPWTPLWVMMKYRGKIKTEFVFSNFSPPLQHTISHFNSSIVYNGPPDHTC